MYAHIIACHMYSFYKLQKYCGGHYMLIYDQSRFVNRHKTCAYYTSCRTPDTPSGTTLRAPIGLVLAASTSSHLVLTQGKYSQRDSIIKYTYTRKGHNSGNVCKFTSNSPVANPASPQDAAAVSCPAQSRAPQHHGEHTSTGGVRTRAERPCRACTNSLRGSWVWCSSCLHNEVRQ